MTAGRLKSYSKLWTNKSFNDFFLNFANTQSRLSDHNNAIHHYAARLIIYQATNLWNHDLSDKSHVPVLRKRFAQEWDWSLWLETHIPPHTQTHKLSKLEKVIIYLYISVEHYNLICITLMATPWCTIVHRSTLIIT